MEEELSFNIIYKNITNKKITDQTIKNTLKKLGLSSFFARNKPLLRKINMGKRIEICINWSYKPDSYLENVIFSD